MVKKEVSKDNSSGTVGVILGILGLVSITVFPLASIILGVVGLVFSVKQKKAHANKWSKAGIILNILSIVLSIIFMLMFILVLSQFAANPELLIGQ